jgi:predicted RNA binding protein YcfA (HicA-like mRNA interferase family)
MSKQDKKLLQMANNHRGWRIEDLQSVADANGIEWVHDGGSHVVFRDKDGAHLTIPAKRPIKPVYIKQFLALVKRESVK